MATIPLFKQYVRGAPFNENSSIIARETAKEPDASCMDRERSLLHGFARNSAGVLKPDGYQRASRARHLAGRMDGRPRARADVRMDRQFHSRHRLLFATGAWALGPSSASFLLYAVDLRRCDALVRKHLWMALARSSSRFCGIRAARRDAVFICSIAPQTAGIEWRNQDEGADGTLDGLRSDRHRRSRICCHLQFC